MKRTIDLLRPEDRVAIEQLLDTPGSVVFIHGLHKTGKTELAEDLCKNRQNVRRVDSWTTGPNVPNLDSRTRAEAKNKGHSLLVIANAYPEGGYEGPDATLRTQRDAAPTLTLLRSST